MNSLILRGATQFLKPLMILVALFLLLRGHHEPGGGFVAGLMGATAYCLHALAYNSQSARQSLPADPGTAMALGLLVAIGSGVPGWFRGQSFLTGVWGDIPVPLLGDLTVGTPLLFDVGVCLLVFGMVLTIFLGLLEHTRGN